MYDRVFVGDQFVGYGEISKYGVVLDSIVLKTVN
jgi:hypothetical protein